MELLLRLQRFLDTINNGSQEEIRFREDRSGIFRSADGGNIRIYFPDPQFKVDEEAIEQLRINLIQAYDLCHNIGARFLVAFAPIKLRVYKDFTEFNGNAVPRDWVFNNLPQRIEAIIRIEILTGQFLDLTVALKAQAKNGSLVYFPGWDTHWSPEGHRIVATAISNVITE